MIENFFNNKMILKGIQKSIHLLSFTRHPSKVLLLDDKICQAGYDVLISDVSKDDLFGIFPRGWAKII